MTTVLDCIIKEISGAARFNSDVQEAPHCILWPDKDRQWESSLPRLQAAIPELFMLGDYTPERRCGPAIWIRCVIARALSDASLPATRTPVVYLPGVSRQDLRAIESCPVHLKPLAELQYRGVIWSQNNAKDWTLLAFLSSQTIADLSLDVAADTDTKAAIQLSMGRVLEQDIASLKGKRLDKDFFNGLLTSGDSVRDVLNWLSGSGDFRSACDESQWKAFSGICRSQFAIDPNRSNDLEVGLLLAQRKGVWRQVWERYSESPSRYPGIPGLLRRCQCPSEIFESAETMGGWPQWNEEQERRLRRELLSLEMVPEHVARKKLLELEKTHGERRRLVWASLGEASLALALQHLAAMAEVTSETGCLGTADDLAGVYHWRGWVADDSVMSALGCVETGEDFIAVSKAIRSVYLPWIEASANALQDAVESSGYPFVRIEERVAKDMPASTCVLFIDGLRFDVAKRLAAMLRNDELQVEELPTWCALPSVTATGKAAVTPISHLVSGEDNTSDFEPCVASTGQSLRGGHHLKKLLTQTGWSLLGDGDCGDPQGKAWAENANIDSEGHQRGWKLSKRLEEILREIRGRVLDLIGAGWKQVRIVTDHGWLLLPEGLPKTDLPMALVESRWGRCAVPKDGARCAERSVPWFWNAHQSVVLARGVSCFQKGEEYTHGGLSFQECYVLHLSVSASAALGRSDVTLSITKWKGLICLVNVDGNVQGCRVDIRLFAADAASSVAHKKKPIGDDGLASVMVEDDSLEGRDAYVVVVDDSDRVLSQCKTKIGGGD